MRNQNTRALALTALYAAGAVVTLYLGTVIPTMGLSFAALAALFTATSVIEGGMKYGVLCFGAAALLGLLLIPIRSGPILYATFFGAYPLVKSIAERRSSRIVGWAIKFGVFFLALIVYMTILRELFLGEMVPVDWAWPVIVLVVTAAFFVYDIGLSKLIDFYLVRIYQQGR